MTPTWGSLASAISALTRRFEDSLRAVRLNADDTMLRVGDAKALNEQRHADNARIKREEYGA